MIQNTVCGFHDQSRILNVTTAVLNHKTTPVGSAPVISWKNYYGFRNAIDIGKTYSKNPHLYMAYIWLNHKAHIFLDTFGLLLGNQKEMRRYRIKVYKDVLKTAIKNQTEYPRITCLEADTNHKGEKRMQAIILAARNGKTFKAADTE